MRAPERCSTRFVAPAYRRRGVAKALLGLMAAWFSEQGARRVCVCVDAGSPAAEPFYDSVDAAPFKRYWRIWDDITLLLRRPRVKDDVLP